MQEKLRQPCAPESQRRASGDVDASDPDLTNRVLISAKSLQSVGSNVNHLDGLISSLGIPYVTIAYSLLCFGNPI